MLYSLYSAELKFYFSRAEIFQVYLTTVMYFQRFFYIAFQQMATHSSILA